MSEEHSPLPVEENQDIQPQEEILVEAAAQEPTDATTKDDIQNQPTSNDPAPADQAEATQGHVEEAVTVTSEQTAPDNAPKTVDSSDDVAPVTNNSEERNTVGVLPFIMHQNSCFFGVVVVVYDIKHRKERHILLGVLNNFDF